MSGNSSNQNASTDDQNTTGPAEGQTGTKPTGGENTNQGNDNPEGAEQLGDAGKRALDAMKAERNQAKKDLADVQKRLQAFEDSQKTAEEKAQAAADAAEKRAREALDKIAAAEARAALTGVVPDPQAFVEDLNLAKYINFETGEVDSDGIAALKEKYAGLAGGQQQKTPAVQSNPAQGANGSNPPGAGQLTHQQIKSMTPGQIIKAKKDGLLNDVLGVHK